MQSKKNKVTPEKIMSKINLEKIKMKPKWYFVAGSVLILCSLMALSVGVVFLVNLMFFALRMQGPMVGWRLAMMLSHFPWWGFVLSLLGVVIGIQLLKKYDFSYKKNFNLIMAIIVLTLLLAGLLFDRMGFNERLMIRGPKTRQFYKNVERGRLSREFVETGEGNGMMLW